ncbi:MAG: hypothetical protein LBB21_00655 [Holosporaceae bacterium]|jgi:hypothetical protein|nr:hypothetical protein [Holosporaceae bacterium]
MNSRKNDIPIISEITNQYLKGNEIIVFAEKSVLESDDYFKCWCDIVYMNFISYCLEKKANIIKKRSNLNYIPENSIVLHYKTSNQDRLQSKELGGFSLVGKCAQAPIFM